MKDDKKIIIFGAGGSGVLLHGRIGESVVCFCDNDPQKQGGKVCGKLVISVEELSDYQFDAIVIASIFAQEIQKQLVELGLGNKIASINNKDISPFRSGEAEISFALNYEVHRPLLKTMHLNLTSSCNLKCRICKPDEFNQKPNFLDLETIKSIVDDSFDQITHLRLDSSGELTLSPHLSYVLKEASRKKISVFISTNGTRISPEIAKLIADSTVETIQISMDSSDPQTNEWIRRGAKHKDIIQGVDNLVSAREKAGSKYPVIHFHGAILQQNIHHFRGLIDLALEKNVDGVTLAYGFIHSFMKPEWSIFFDQDLCNEKVLEAKEYAERKGIFFNAPMPFHQTNQTENHQKFCEFLYGWTYVDPSGEIYPCCTAAGHFSLGNAKKDKIRKIWKGEKYTLLRNTYNTDNPALAKCSHCYIMTGWNVDDFKVHFAPEHWKFVEKRLENGAK